MNPSCPLSASNESLTVPITPALLRTVYGSLMQHQAEHHTLGAAMHEKPYTAPPRAPVLYVKPANTFRAYGQTTQLPERHTQVQVRPCLALFYMPNQASIHMKYTQKAINFIASVCCDLTLAQRSYFRPPVRFNAFDGSLGLPRTAHLIKPDDLLALRVNTTINGKQVHSHCVADLVSTPHEHWNAVRSFITFEPGDVLMLGCPPDAPLAQAGDHVQIQLEGLGEASMHLKGAA